MIKIYNMDVMKALKQMLDESVDMQITSPPYWGLRDYGIGKNQLGLEPSFEEYVKRLCDIFDEVKRVLKKDGTCWINLGDTYSGGCNFAEYKGLWHGKKVSGKWKESLEEIKKAKKQIDWSQIPAKCLTCVPERFILEMINRGWILRNKIIWHKPNHMPTSVKDRFANSWEYLFLFSKSKKYYFDLDAVREPHKAGVGSKFNLRVRDVKRGYAQKSKQYKASEKEVEQYHGQNIIENPKGKNPDDVISVKNKYVEKERKAGFKGRYRDSILITNRPSDYFGHPLGKNPSDFWDITTRGYPEAHFAVFPEALVERPIKTTRKNAIIMDIFAGSGTTLKVARRLNRDSIGIEIKKEYCDLIRRRLFGRNQTLFPEEFEIITDIVQSRNKINKEETK